MKKHKIRVYLKDGRILKFRAGDYSLTRSGDGSLKSFRFTDTDRDVAFSIEAVIALEVKR